MFFFFQAEDGIRDTSVTGVQTCALPIWRAWDRVPAVRGEPMIETIDASRCPRCDAVVAPPATWCPWHPVPMTPTSVRGVGQVITFTTLHAAPEGFRSPLHIAIVELEGGARR